MTTTKELTCIRCPLGCSLQVTLDDGIVSSVTGNSCRLGIDYAEKESVCPTRTVTSTIPISGGDVPMLPVRTAGEIPKSCIMEAMDAIYCLRAMAPVKVGEVLAKDIAGTGVALIATRSISATTNK